MSTRRPAALVTRPEPGATETAARLRACGWTPVLAPALILEPRATQVPAGAQALLLPSAAAIAAAAAAAAPDLPTLAVGEATAAAARRAGLIAARAAGGDAASLAALAAATLAPCGGPLWLAAGEGYGAELEGLLRQRGFTVVRTVAYAATPASRLPPDAVEMVRSGAVVAALFFSPRSAECAITLLRSAGFVPQAAAMAVVALSSRVAEAARAALAPASWNAVRIAARPNQESLLRELHALAPPSGAGQHR